MAKLEGAHFSITSFGKEYLHPGRRSGDLRSALTRQEFRFTPALFGPKSSRTHSAFAARAFYERFLELNHSTIVKKWYSALEGRLRTSRVRSYVLWRSASHSSFVLDLGVLFYRPRMGLRNSAM